MKRNHVVVVALVSMAFAASASAESARIGGGVELLPIGELHFDDGNDSATVDAETAFALAGRVEVPLNPNLAIAFAPRLVLNLKDENSNESAKQLDLVARLVGGVPVGTGATRLYGYAAPGYSIIFIPDWPDGISRPAGLVLGFGGGAAFRLTPEMELTAEIGYQLGFQEVSVNGATVELSTNLLHIGAGILIAL